MSDDNLLQLDPIWRNAAERAHQQFSYGDLIPWAWLRRELEIEPMEAGTHHQFQALQFKTLELMDKFREYLLTTHCKAVVNVRSEGYRIVSPAQQTETAITGLAKDLQRSIHAAQKLLSRINFTLLNDAQIKENADARGRLAAIHAFTSNRVRRLK